MTTEADHQSIASHFEREVIRLEDENARLRAELQIAYDADLMEMDVLSPGWTDRVGALLGSKPRDQSTRADFDNIVCKVCGHKNMVCSRHDCPQNNPR